MWILIVSIFKGCNKQFSSKRFSKNILITLIVIFMPTQKFYAVFITFYAALQFLWRFMILYSLGALSKNPSLVNAICIGLFHCWRDYLCEISLEADVANDKDNGRNEVWTLYKEIKLEWLHKVVFKCQLKSWSDSSVG